MHIWNVSAAALQLQAGPLRPHIFGSRLYFRHQTGVDDISGYEQSDGTVLFDVSEAQVAQVLAKSAYLFLTTRHVLHVGSGDLHWGWRYRVLQGTSKLPATDGDGVPLGLDGKGFFNSLLEQFDSPVELSRETIIFS